MIKLRTAFSFVSGLAMLACVPASADNDAYIATITAQLEQAEVGVQSTANGQGWESEPVLRMISKTDESTNADFYLTNLIPGEQYMIVGVCDGDCTDVDLKLYDDDGDAIDSDIEDDDAPIVEFQTDASHDYYNLTLDMVTCDEDYCFYGISVFRIIKGQGSNGEEVDHYEVIERQITEIEVQLETLADAQGKTISKVMNETGILMEGTSQDFDLEALGGIRNYAAVAVCDRDCGALGLTLLSASEMTGQTEPEIVDEVTDRTDAPSLEFFANPFQDYTLQVEMTECSDEPCLFGYAVYQIGQDE